MTRSLLIDLDTGITREVSDREFFTAIFGHPPRTAEERAEAARAYWAEEAARRDPEREAAELQERVEQAKAGVREGREREAAALKALPPLKFEVMSGSLFPEDVAEDQLTVTKGDPLPKKRRAA